MSAKSCSAIIICLILIVLLNTIPAPAGGVRESTTFTPPHSSASTTVTVGLYIIGFGNFDVNRGTYTFDFYMWLRWNDSSGIDPLKFEFMNGRATTKEKLSDETDNVTEMRTVWYRIQAVLFSEPKFDDYPFDKQTLTIILEDTALNSSRLVYVSEKTESGFDPSVKVSGWNIEGWDFSASEKGYPWGENYSRLIFNIKIGRERTTTAIKTFLPPIIFCIVSGLSFFFRPDKITNRIGFGTSMLISAVMFHISQTASLPPMPSLMMIDKIMIATYSFLAASLIVTTIIYIDEEFIKDKDYTKLTNRCGALISIILPFVVYAVLA